MRFANLERRQVRGLGQEKILYERVVIGVLAGRSQESLIPKLRHLMETKRRGISEFDVEAARCLVVTDRFEHLSIDLRHFDRMKSIHRLFRD